MLQLTAKQLKDVAIDDVRGDLIYIQHLSIKTMLDGRLDLDYLANHFENYARTGEFSRRMELELGLTISSDMSINQKGKQQAPRQDIAIINLRSLVDQVLAKVSSVEEFGKQMQTHGFKTYIGRGIAFFNMQNRMKVKGSDLGKDYSLQNLEQRMGMEMLQAVVPVKRKKKSRRKQQGLSI